eukprot:1618883-Prymnesium_polylepis.1
MYQLAGASGGASLRGSVATGMRSGETWCVGLRAGVTADLGAPFQYVRDIGGAARESPEQGAA